MKRGMRYTLAGCLSATMMAAAALPAAADYGPVVVKTLPNLNLVPYSLITGTDGSFYGITNNGASLERIQPNGIVKTLLTPAMTDPSGWQISHVVQGSDGTLYIATTSGGSGNAGVVSKLKPDGTLTVLHDFSAATPQGLVYVNADGGDPVDLALASDGSLLGVTAAFGPQGGGTVFRIAQDGSFSMLTSFNGDYTQQSAGGYSPAAVLQGKDGQIYALNVQGDVNGTGALVKLAGSGAFSRLVANDGSAKGIRNLVQDGNGNFYSVDTDSNIWKVTPTGQISAIQNDFYLMLSDETLFASPDGHIYASSRLSGAFNAGFLAQVVNGADLQALTFFGYPQHTGTEPTSATVGTDGNLYGVTSSGNGLFGSSAALYKLTLPPPAGWGTGPAPAVTLSLNPATITVGQSSTISWTISGSGNCELIQDFGGTPQVLAGNGSKVFKPLLKGQYVFELDCANNGMSSHDQVMLNVLKK